MNIRESEDADEFTLNLTPMIDVVFLLLIFFMVATTFMDPEREIEIELPSAASAGEPEPEPEEIVLNVMENGSVIYQTRELDPDSLLDLLRSTAQRDADTPVTIRGHRSARHEMIVRVMDACGTAGLVNLAVGTASDEG